MVLVYIGDLLVQVQFWISQQDFWQKAKKLGRMMNAIIWFPPRNIICSLSHNTTKFCGPKYEQSLSWFFFVSSLVHSFI
jgi:hypothetical protein